MLRKVLCVLLFFIKPTLGNRDVRSRGFIVSDPRETHPQSEIADVPTSPCSPLEPVSLLNRAKSGKIGHFQTFKV